ncbi:acetyl-CoA carboxylase biotin carboxylase subunit [Companilactobacillus mishanensis]|uniref:biotin carboxylase n=1 Tax=Companilactobacillus mishanensis TaxID=2486008 RepID=A0A5P0ZJ93_9LACO|nr:acetyl-CoA carboxylase biotin carboxylase subunit [Companilactobacillus mishanensis]MQS53108.1 acetyl-CoA carboxylase biotin carboxylase subunit [Companilactobacillus mishanensis]
MEKILIANRGEIAIRIIRACKILNIPSVAVYSTADKTAMHVAMADESVCIGGPNPEDSYLNQESLISAAQITQADAIHPGYGFLSENADFAKLCEDSNIKFIGPSSKVISIMGEKAAARETMIKAGVPVIPGSDSDFLSFEDAKHAAEEIGYPVMLKASAGGGGKGMRVITSPDDFENQFNLAQSEAQSAFGDGHMYVEKYLAHPRHIEVQIAADKFNNAVAIGERDCSLQRRHQKVIEEAPAYALDEETREQMYDVSVQAAKDIHYEGLGTMEFLFDGPGKFYFMEMNTRVQVEHPITELTTDVDLVDLQIKIAQGEPLPFAEVTRKNFALECRVNAKTAGKIDALHLPAGHGIRVDSALYQGYSVPANYDSMIAKIISYGPDRATVITQMSEAINETVIAGIATNLDFLSQVLQEPEYLTNNTDIGWLDKLTKSN